MTDHIGFQVDPGIELRAALRGPRLSLGPRIDRVEEDAPGDDRWVTWADLAGGGLLPEPPPKSRRARRRKRQEWQTIHDHLVAVTTMHERPVARARQPDPAPEPIDHDDIRQDLLTEATEGISPLALVARGRARRATRDQLDAAVRERASVLRDADEQARTEISSWWRSLVDNDPVVVRERLRLAFDDHRFAAAVANVADERADLVVPVAKPSALVGDREPTTEPGGARTLPKMSKERRHELYEAAIGSGLLSTAAEAFAVAPGLERSALAVVAPEHVGGPAVLMAVEVSRQLVLPSDADRAAIGSIAQIEQAEGAGLGRVVIDRGDVSGALRPLDPSHPDVAPILAVLTTELTS